MLVVIVIAGVDVAVATEPPKPFADTTEAVVTVPVPPPPEGATLCQVVPLDVKTFPEVDGATKVGAEVPAPRITLLVVSVARPVPPEVTASVALKPAAVPELFWFRFGKVQLAKFPDVGVPSKGVISVGEVSITNLVPVPVCEAITVALPVLVITPVRFAFVVTVALLPVIDPLGTT